MYQREKPRGIGCSPIVCPGPRFDHDICGKAVRGDPDSFAVSKYRKMSQPQAHYFPSHIPQVPYRIPCKKLFSLILLLLAALMALVNPSLASNALLPSAAPIPAGRSIDCSWSGTETVCEVPCEPVFRARAALEARRRCFFDFAKASPTSPSAVMPPCLGLRSPQSHSGYSESSLATGPS